MLLLISLKWMKKRFDILELFLLYMFTSVFCQQFFYVFASPYPMINVVEEYLPFLAARIQYSVSFPILLMWVLYYLKGNNRLSIRIGVCFCWVTGGVLMEKIMLLLGILTTKEGLWRPYIDMVMAMIVLVLSVYFMEIMHPILKKEKMVR
jgi:hypothetical protein